MPCSNNNDFDHCIVGLEFGHQPGTRQLCFPRPVISAWCVLVLCAVGFGQVPCDRSPQPDANLQPHATLQPKQRRHVPVFGNADEFALAGDFEYYVPQPGFDRNNRDIDLQVAAIALVAHMRHGWGFQFDGLALRAHGYRTLPGGAPYPQISSNGAGLGGGPLARWNFLQFSRFRAFVEAGGAFILFDRPLPALGTINDFFLRAGGGVSVKLSHSYWVESTFHFAHISNGECFCTGNPTWQGNGLSLDLRRTFGHEPERLNTPGKWPFRNADENAWITSVEDYTPVPGLNRKNGAVEADMRQLRISRAWHFPEHLELQLGGLVQTNRTMIGFGPVLRWNFLERGRWRLFVDGGADFLQSAGYGDVIPWKDSGYNLFLRGRGGASFRLHESYWLEAGFGWANVSPGFGVGKLLPWTGQGASLALRHAFPAVHRFWPRQAKTTLGGAAANRNRVYVPEWLLEAWGIQVEAIFSGVA